MTADAFLNFVGAHHHGEGVPAYQTLDATLHLLAAGEWRLLRRSNRVLVGSGRGKWQVHSRGAACVQRQLLQQPPRADRTATLGQHVVQRVDPLPRFQYLLTVSFRLSHV